jgi:hypothetical protein
MGEAGWLGLALGLDWVLAQNYRKPYSFFECFIKQTRFFILKTNLNFEGLLLT